MILDVRLHNLPIIVGFVLSIFLLTSVYYFVKGKIHLGLLFLTLTIVPMIVAVWLFT